MGNKALRKQVVEAMKSAGFSGNLYHGNKRAAHEYFNAYWLRRHIRMLSFKKRDLVHDCDAFNHRFEKHLPFRTSLLDGTTVFCIDQVEFDDGSRSCGCPDGVTNALTRDEVERYWFAIVNDKEHVDRMKNGGWWDSWHQRVQDTLKSGKPICDDDGIALSEFSRNARSVMTRLDKFFNDHQKSIAWMSTPNDLLGGVSPDEMIKIGRYEKLFDFVQQSLRDNISADQT